MTLEEVLARSTFSGNIDLSLLTPGNVKNLFDEVVSMATNIEMDSLNLNSTIIFLDLINNFINKTTVLDVVASLGLTDCVSVANDFFTAQADVLSGNSIRLLQDEILSFYASYGSFMNSSSLPMSLKDGEEHSTCLSSLASFPSLINNLTEMITFTTTQNFAENLISLKESFQSLQSNSNKDDIGNCNWPLKYSIWKMPGTALIPCDNSTGNETSKAPDAVDTIQMGLLNDLTDVVTNIATSVIPANVIDECTTMGLMEATKSCNNESNVVLTDVLNLLTVTLSTVKNLDATIIAPLKHSLEEATSGNLSFSKYKFATEFQRTTGNLTSLILGLKTLGTFMEKLSLAMVGNVVNLIPKLYSNLDQFKLIPIAQEELLTLELFSDLTNGTGGTSVEDALKDKVADISRTLETVGSELTTIVADLQEVTDQLTNNLNNYILDVDDLTTFYR